MRADGMEPGEDDLGRWRLALPTLVTLLVLALAAEALMPAVVSAKPESGRGRVNTEVVGGQLVAQGKFRFTTLVFVEVSQDEVLRCGGSLIAPRFVLTAAHCVEDLQGNLLGPGDFTLIVGRAELSDFRQGVVRGVVDVAQHPGWDPGTDANDVAVLELDAAVPKGIARPVALVGAGETRFNDAGQPVVVAGWGTTSDGGANSNRLRAANLEVVGNAACEAAYEEFGGIVPAVMVCAAFRGRDSCQGDSGGPLFAREVIGFDVKKKKKKKGHKRRTVRTPIYRDVQMGIVSFGVGCADPEIPGVYARLSNPDINAFIVGELDS